MAKIAVIGICGKSVFMSVDHFHSNGETLIADGIYEEMGGKGFNQSIAAARMGAEVSFLAAVGDDLAADECENILHNNKIKPCLMRKKGKNTPVAFILTDKNGENQVTEFKDSELAVEDVLCFEHAATPSCASSISKKLLEAHKSFRNYLSSILSPLSMSYLYYTKTGSYDPV